MLCIPVLLEGSPGVGKTSLIVALGKFSGHNVVRINLSEQVSNFFGLSYSHITYIMFIYIDMHHLLTFFYSFFSMHLGMVHMILLQTDMMDLLGSDLPVESDEGMKFAWSDGIFLQVKTPYLESLMSLPVA